MSEHDEIIRLVAEYDRLSEYCAENPNDSDAEVEFERFCEEWPGIAEGLWDSKGNYVGEIRNENGWTP
jgi:hypothetical protein